MTRAAVDRLGGLPATGLLAVPLALAVGAAATVSPRYTVAGAVGLVLVLLTLSNLTYGIALFTLLTFFERISFLAATPLTKPMGLVLVTSWLLSFARSGRSVPFLPRDQPVLSFCLAGFVVLALSSTAWAESSGAVLGSALRLAQVVVLFFIVYSALRTPRDLTIVTWAFLTGAFLVAGQAIATGADRAGRLSGGVLDPNFLAAALVASSVIAAFMLSGTRSPAVRTLLVVFMAVYATGLVRTESRSGLVAAAISLVVAVVVAGPYRSRVLAGALVLASAGLVYYAVLAPAALRERVTSVSAEDSASRTDTWQIALRMADDHPLVGVGLANFPVVQTEYIPQSINLIASRIVRANRLVAHNTYLEVLAELGAAGIAVLAAIVALSVAAAWRGIRQLGDRTPIGLTMRGFLTGVCGLLAAYVFLSGQYEKHLWLLLGVLASFPTIARSVVQSQDR